MLNQVFKVSSCPHAGTCQQFVEDAVKISNIFLDFRLSQHNVATYAGEVEVFVFVHREFSDESVG